MRFTLLSMTLLGVASTQQWVIDDGFCLWANQIRCRTGQRDVAAVREQVQVSLQSVAAAEWLSVGVPPAAFQKVMDYIETAPCTDNATECTPFRPWLPCADGPVAAPKSHHLITNTSALGLLSVTVPTSTREPFHTHQAFSVMLVNIGGDDGDGQRYFNEHDEIVFDHPPHPPNPNADIHVQWMQPEWFHSIQNTGPLHHQGAAAVTGAGAVAAGGYAALRAMLLDTGPVAAAVPAAVAI
jgi:hypothetical protein